MFEEEYICNTEPLILWFENVNEAVAFAKDIEIKNQVLKEKEIYEENKGDEAWIYVLAICDICSRKSQFFAPVEIYEEDEITAIECKECKNMSVYPQEGSWDDV